jgi:hypothetical protein
VLSEALHHLTGSVTTSLTSLKDLPSPAKSALLESRAAVPRTAANFVASFIGLFGSLFLLKDPGPAGLIPNQSWLGMIAPSQQARSMPRRLTACPSERQTKFESFFEQNRTKDVRECSDFRISFSKND